MLQALRKAAGEVDIIALDAELAKLAPKTGLARLATGGLRNVIAIEVKAGTDFSNIHNRIGEAEKSHQKAKQAGCTECWTIVNVDQVDLTSAHMESPSTNRFYRLSRLEARKGSEYSDFRARILGLTGIAAATLAKRRKKGNA